MGKLLKVVDYWTKVYIWLQSAMLPPSTPSRPRPSWFISTTKDKLSSDWAKKIWLLSAIRQNDTFTRLLWTSSHRNFIKGLCSLTFLILPGCLWYTIYHYYFHRNKWQDFITILENSCYVFFFSFLKKIKVPRNISIPANIINQRGHSFLKTQTKYTFSSPNSKEFLA